MSDIFKVINSRIGLLEPDSRGCKNWVWTKNRAGYGTIKSDYKTYYVGRVLLTFNYKSLLYNDNRWETMHICDNPSCVNIYHLTVGTRQLNQYDRVIKGRHDSSTRTHCAKGHEFTDSNTLHSFSEMRNQRQCRTCNRERTRTRRAHLKERTIE